MADAATDGGMPERRPKLMDQARAVMRTRHVAKRTEEAYLAWIHRYLLSLRDRHGQWVHPLAAGNDGVNQFLTHLAVDRNVAASTQNQALSALLFLYTKVLKSDAVRAKPSTRLPVVLTPDEVRSILSEIPAGPRRIMVAIMYGAGLRVMEVCRLRVKDVDFERRQITVRQAKGDKDRCVPLPRSLEADLRQQIQTVRQLHEQDLAAGAGWVWLPHALAVKWPQAGRSLAWQYLFPADRLSVDSHPRETLEEKPEEEHVGLNDRRQLRRHHVHETTVQAAVTAAVKKARITKKVTCHTFRHSFATHVSRLGASGVESPLDRL